MEERGRADSAGSWPQRRPVGTLAAILAGILVAVSVGAYDYAVVWTPLQRAYLPAYLQSQVRASVGLQASARYRVVYVDGRLAVNADVVAPEGVLSPSWPSSATQITSPNHVLEWRDRRFDDVRLGAWLAAQIYGDRLRRTMTVAVRTGIGVLAMGLIVGVPRDLAARRAHRHGRRLKGPELLSARQFNRRSPADGIAFPQQRSLGQRPLDLAIPRSLEASHILIMGDSGTGKSVLIREILRQIADRHETAIVYDPALEYTRQFYQPNRGDLILNPLDARSPYWTPGDEWRHEAETLTLATSLFPDRHHENAFFTEAPRRVFAHLLTLRPSPAQLAAWLCDGDALDRLLAGTPYATMVDREAPAQRSGVLASLNMIADTLKLLPTEPETTGRWSATAWAAAPSRGWLFLTSTPETRPRLVPLTSLWLDALVLRLMHLGRADAPKTWFVLDELASLQRLPQLHTAITENRKSNNPVVLGFQGRSQLETRYGHDAEAMLSQPATKIFLRTSEPRAAKWIADTIGEVEIERLRESRAISGHGQRSYSLERQVEPLVMASEIGGLNALRGLLKVGNLVVRLRFRFQNLPACATAFIERRRSAPVTLATKPAGTAARTPRTIGLGVATPAVANSRDHFFG